MNCLELRTAVMPVGMTAASFDPWHCVFVEWDGHPSKGRWRVTDEERRTLHTVTNEWTDTVMPELRTVTRREAAIKSARRYLLTGHHGGRVWTKDDPTPEHLVADILLHIEALNAQAPRPNSGLRVALNNLSDHLAQKWGLRPAAYPTEYVESHTLTVQTGQRLAKNIAHDLEALAALGKRDAEAERLHEEVQRSVTADAFTTTVTSAHARAVLPLEYLSDSKISSIQGLITTKEASLLIDCYEEGIDAEVLAVLPEITPNSVAALRQMLKDDVGLEYIRAAFGS